MIRLSRRLSAVADCVLPGEPLADIGTDHALLPVALVQRGAIPRAIAGDVREGPAQAAQRQVSEAGLAGRIDVRVGDGLAVLRPGEAVTVAIAGMGGGTIVDILSSGGEALEGVRRLVLQPNVGERLVRSWLLEHGWKLTAETLLEEDGILYEVLVADAAESGAEADRWNDSLYALPPSGEGRITRSALLLMGPHLLREPGPLLISKWNAHLDKLTGLLANVSRSSQPEAVQRRRELEQEHEEVGEVLRWLSK